MPRKSSIAKETNVRLIEAVIADDVAQLKAALADGADVNARVELARYAKNIAYPPQPALSWAMSAAMVEHLLAAGANLDGTDEEGYTALHRAVLNARDRNLDHHSAIVDVLLRRGANPNSRARTYYSTPLEQSTLSGAGIARRLLEHGARVTPTALERARHWPELVTLFEEWPIRSAAIADPDKALMLAARAGDLAAVNQCLREGAHAIARDADGRSAVEHALVKGHPAIAHILEHVATSVLDAAELFAAVIDDSPERIVRACQRFGSDVRNAEGMTPLMLAARHGGLDAAACLLTLGASIHLRNGARTALVYAIENGHLALVQRLLDRGAQFDALSADGVNPVLVAAGAQRDSDILKLLIVRGVNFAAFPSLRVVDGEAQRLLAQARAGKLPVAGRPRFSSAATCVWCADLPNVMGWYEPTIGNRTGNSLPAITEQLETFQTGWQPLWKCPQCGTYYEYERDHDNGMTDGYDSESLTRITPERALEKLRAADASARVAREIEQLATRLALR